MQQPLLRYASRSLFESVITSAAPGSTRRLAIRPSTTVSRPASICLQCQFRAPQRRHFANDSRPPSSTSPLSPPIRLGPPEPLPASQTPTHNAEPAPPPPNPENDEPPSSQSSPQHDKPSGLQPELPSAGEERRSALSKRLTYLMDNLQGNIFIASQRLNDLTGYSGIEALKTSITAQEKRLAQAQEDVRAARTDYKTLVASRAASQREVTTLLARKDTWTPIDLERFTSLYRSDHGNEHAVQEAAQKLADTERASEQAASKLNSNILARYHEEQIWSDKIRRMSTWGTWGLMGVNVLLFLVFQFGFEPWRRARLVRGFEEKVQEALQKEKESWMSHRHENDVLRQKAAEAVVAAGVEEAEAGEEKASDLVVEALAASIKKDAEESTAVAAVLSPVEEVKPVYILAPISAEWSRPETWKQGLLIPCKERFLDLFSERAVSLRMQDVTIIALEGVAAGAATVGLIAMFILKPR